MERVDDGVDDRGRRADGAGLAGAFDAERIGIRRHVAGGESEIRRLRRRAAWRSP